jgi:hypothetical protein
VKRRKHWLDRIAALDPAADHREIYRISAGRGAAGPGARMMDYFMAVRARPAMTRSRPAAREKRA